MKLKLRWRLDRWRTRRARALLREDREATPQDVELLLDTWGRVGHEGPARENK